MIRTGVRNRQMSLTACFDMEVVPVMWSERMESGQLKIVSVGALDGDSLALRWRTPLPFENNISLIS